MMRRGIYQLISLENYTSFHNLKLSINIVSLLQVMRVHASRKSILEVEFREEEGTGLGPTLEFYALVAW